ncbi:hypothetical protein CY34DRAFT_549723 [Suillus luteus UH-Slu-Lm8-n1]|uniref:Uncharacterized protein n=1 Tax=Suillus luteus UH-Slu-Lm8-n1 TaxID=930992 RepID=A0A0C9ZEU0_9AGAM|nr:hypothetical protein CY34DRAFT_549723 [Suillus luteus UH-Slu-Lm8-n1]
MSNKFLCSRQIYLPSQKTENFASPGPLSTMFDSPIGPFTASASRCAGKLFTASTIDVPFHYYLSSQEYLYSRSLSLSSLMPSVVLCIKSLFSGHLLCSIIPQAGLCLSIAQSSPVSLSLTCLPSWDDLQTLT